MKKGLEKILWVLFLLSIAVLTVDAIDIHFMADFIRSQGFFYFMVSFPVLLLILHSIWAMGYYRTFLFILIASATGLIFEVIGVNHTSVFGGSYIYKNIGFMIFNVPLLVPIYWSVFIYVGYTLTSSFLFWINRDKPNKFKKDIILMILMILLDGLLVTGIDVFMDPLQVKEGTWTWIEKGPYYGIPIGNFIGWFAVTIISVSLFRTFEYYYPQKSANADRSIFIMPVASYGMFCIHFISYALAYKMPELVLIGTFVMMPVVIANLILFANWKLYHRKNQ